MPFPHTPGRRRGPFRSVIAATALAACAIAIAACRDVTRPMGLAGMYSLSRIGDHQPWEPIIVGYDTIMYSGGEATFTEHHEAHVRVYATERVFGTVRYDTIDEQGSWSGPVGTFGLPSGGLWDGYQLRVPGYPGEAFARFDDVRIGGYTFHRHF